MLDLIFTILHLYKENKLTNRISEVFMEISNNIVLVRNKLNAFEAELLQLKETNERLHRQLLESEELINQKNKEISNIKESLNELSINSVKKENETFVSNKEIENLINEIEFCIEKLKENNG